MKTLIAILGVILLLPIIISIPSYISCIADIIEIFNLSQSDPKNLAGTISAQIVHQIQALIVSMPGLIIVSITIFRLKYNPKWYSSILKIYSALAICMLPILTFVGIYVYLISKKYRYIVET